MYSAGFGLGLPPPLDKLLLLSSFRRPTEENLEGRAIRSRDYSPVILVSDHGLCIVSLGVLYIQCLRPRHLQPLLLMINYDCYEDVMIRLNADISSISASYYL